jgi:DNA topoisomerase I
MYRVHDSHEAALSDSVGLFLAPRRGGMAANWIRRQGNKTSGFRYVDGHGHPVRAREVLDRINALRIPPAWRDVHIARSARREIQAWGFDARGRKQYRYHERAVQRGELRKYHRVRRMALALPEIRERLHVDSGRAELTREKVAAGVLRLIARGFFRIGSERYAKENRTFGITTLRKSHVHIENHILTFEYVGKRGILQRQVINDPELATFVDDLRGTPGRRLFRYRSDEGVWCDLTARDVNEYLRRIAGAPYTAKDLRTWGGTLKAAIVLADIGAAKSAREAKRNAVLAVRLVAAELGNTPAICRKSYVHPMILARYLDSGETIAAYMRRAAPRTPFGHAPEERALIRFLDKYFPERRKRRRREKPAEIPVAPEPSEPTEPGEPTEPSEAVA